MFGRDGRAGGSDVLVGAPFKEIVVFGNVDAGNESVVV